MKHEDLDLGRCARWRCPVITPILRATHGDAFRDALTKQRDMNARCLDALRAMLARNQRQQEAVEAMAAKPAPLSFDVALELLIVAAWKGRDVTRERAAVRRLFEGLEITHGMVREEVLRG